MTRNVDQLRSIQTFEELIPFLEDDLDWPFPHGSREYEIGDLTFEYTPDELGLEDEYAAKIKRIHQLRPLVSGQPWGIFFVEFENKKLPIVVLRRILSHLVLKQRKSANPADRARWNAGDLLFISAFAEEGTLQREIAFAHFHQDPGDQPTLRVLGWDGGDTPLKLEHVSQILRHRLSWPRNPTDHVAWRKQWAGAFRHTIGQQIRTADLLAQELARVARNIRDAAMALMKVESSRGPLRRMHEAFRIALIHDLTQEGFADTYAQTITYGLLTAAISRTDRSAGADGTFVLAEDVHNMVPITNPFLKEMLESFLKVGGRGTSKQPGLDFDELGVQEVVEMLRSSEIDLPAVLDDFGNRNPGEDPVIRFYEDFLKAYNKKLKVQRGVFYTPQPVVSYIVRSIHELLQREFNLPDGLASSITWGAMASQMLSMGTPLTIPDGTSPDSHFVVILDPATGTATFLVEVIDVIFATMQAKWKQQGLTAIQRRHEWNRYVPENLLPRLFGYELMMAPYAIAHMKIGLKLGETGFDFATECRVQVFLTNALESQTSHGSQLSISDWAPALAHEAEAVSKVKTGQRFTVILGNPPYSKMSGNLGPEAVGLVEPFRSVEGNKIIEKGALAFELNLQDDYVKFWGLIRKLILEATTGIAGFITNSRYLASTSLRGMRWSLSGAFGQASFVDLLGQVSERTTVDSTDENVFDIEQGVAIGVCWRLPIHKPLMSAHFQQIAGKRERKYEVLNGSTITSSSTVIPITSPFFRFSRISNAIEVEFAEWPELSEIMPFNSGCVITSRDNLATDFEEAELLKKIARFASSPKGDLIVQEDIGFSVKSKWNVEATKAEIRRDKHPSSRVRRILYRPFDERFIFYLPSLLDTPSKPVCDSIYGHETLVLLTPRIKTSAKFSHALIAQIPAEKKSCSHDRATQMFPLYQFPDGLLAGHGGYPNISAPFLERLSRSSGCQVSPEQAMSYIYAVLYSGTYRERYGDALRDAYPRIPTPNEGSLFGALANLGHRIIKLHVLDFTEDEKLKVTYEGPSLPLVQQRKYSEETISINEDSSASFVGIPRAVWEFEVGGYQVCDKWLKDRKGRTLSSDEIGHFSKIVNAIFHTIQLTVDIDEAIEQHGGWPGAFA